MNLCISPSKAKNDSFSLSCYWCPGATNSSLKCRHFRFNTAIPINGIECPQLKYHVGTCVCKFCVFFNLVCVLDWYGGMHAVCACV